MSMVTELFGEKILLASLAEVKAKIKTLPPTLKEKKAYTLADFARIKGIKLTVGDYFDIGV